MHCLSILSKNCVNIKRLLQKSFLFNTWSFTLHHLIDIHHGQLVFPSVLEKFDMQHSFRIVLYCSNASNDKLMESSLHTLCKTTEFLCNINWICGLNMPLILNSFYHHNFHLTATLIVWRENNLDNKSHLHCKFKFLLAYNK